MNRIHTCFAVFFAGSMACTPFKPDAPPEAGPSSGDSSALLDAGEPASPSDGPGEATDAVFDASCVHREPPPRGSITDAGGALDFTLAVSDYTATDDAGGRMLGFDLDDRCTGEGQDASCDEPGWAHADHTDGVGGIDNAVGQVWRALGVVVDEKPWGPTPTLILRIAGYSGGADDDQVDVSLYVGLLAPRADGGGDPVWDGNDRWYLLPAMLAPSSNGGAPSANAPRFHDDHGYVSHGTLVAQFPNALVSLTYFYAPATLYPISQLVLVGSLSFGSNGWELHDAVEAYLVKANDLLPILELLATSPTNGSQVLNCQIPSQQLILKEEICPFVDISSVPGPAPGRCDALSAAARLQAKQVVLGDVLPPLPPPPASLACPPSYDAALDTCDSLGDP